MFRFCSFNTDSVVMRGHRRRCAVFSSLLLLASTLVMVGCEDKWSKMPDDELAAKRAECLNMNEPAPAMIQVCENYKRECDRRREDEGRYVCW